ncbi:MAG: 50S ribosomal protein L16 3-hydroxylase [Candidatus Celerinatantimonas neptuna]|nr:MAG: 50S ribosomal protein L16 3-hydroxylase [Candidatus Celerinatantimonas neptuna]
MPPLFYWLNIYMKINFDINHFMVDYWQRQPLVIRQGIEPFPDLLSPEELAGLAMEEEVQSRIVTNHRGNWQAISGPFEQFEKLEQNASTLLVQATNHWHPNCSQLAELFHFIPNWRFDDVMVSYATEQGGVGPHIDQYGVFIIQGSGSRHWKVGACQPLCEFATGDGLKQCEEFKPVIDTVLNTGDILYIPPGCPHCGISLSPSMSYSVGFRAPDQRELFNAFADYLLDDEQNYSRYSDPELSNDHAWGEITRHQQQKLMGLMQNMVNDSRLMRDFFGRFFSATQRDINVLPLDEQSRINTTELISTLNHGISLHRVEGLKVLYLQGLNELFIDGESYPFSANAESYRLLANQMSLNLTHLSKAISDPEFTGLLTQWVNSGFWYWNE